MTKYVTAESLVRAALEEVVKIFEEFNQGHHALLIRAIDQKAIVAKVMPVEPVAWQHKKPIENNRGEVIGYSNWKDGRGAAFLPERALYAALVVPVALTEEEEQAAFETAFAGCAVFDRLERLSDAPIEYLLDATQCAWEGWRAGRAALAIKDDEK